MTPYTYFIKNKITGQFYYGSRGRKSFVNRLPEDDLWIKYFTSSNFVKNLISEHGKDSFEFSIMLIDESYDNCYWYEQRLIKDNMHHSLCLNRYYIDSETNKKKFSSYGRKVSDSEKAKKSAAMMNTTITEETRTRQSVARKDKILKPIKKPKKSKSLRTYEDISGIEVATARKLNASIKTTEQHKNNPSGGNKNANAKIYNMIDPTGQEFIVNGNLISFCKEHKLNAGLVIATAKGRRPHYRNWIITYGIRT